MTRSPAAGSTGEPTKEHIIDTMVEQTFPASDATQLPGRAAGAPGAGASAEDANRSAGPHESVPGTPRTIGNQGVAPASRMLEETIDLAEGRAMTLRFDAELRRLFLFASDDGMALDARALDRLIAALSAKRALLGE